MKFFKSLSIQLGILFGYLITIGAYIWGFIILCGYTFHHWWVQNDGYWYCSNAINKYTHYCKSAYNDQNIHWGLILFIIGWIILSSIIGFIIAEAMDESKR